jgi:hypothetical protein
MPKHSNPYQIHKILHEKFGENLRTHMKKSEIFFLVRPVRNLGKFFCVCSGIKALGMNTHFHKFCSGIILVRNLGKFLFTPTTLIPVHTYKLHLYFWQCAQSEICVTLVINWGKLMFTPIDSDPVHTCKIRLKFCLGVCVKADMFDEKNGVFPCGFSRTTHQSTKVQHSCEFWRKVD